MHQPLNISLNCSSNNVQTMVMDVGGMPAPYAIQHAADMMIASIKIVADAGLPAHELIALFSGAVTEIAVSGAREMQAAEAEEKAKAEREAMIKAEVDRRIKAMGYEGAQRSPAHEPDPEAYAGYMNVMKAASKPTTAAEALEFVEKMDADEALRRTKADRMKEEAMAAPEEPTADERVARAKEYLASMKKARGGEDSVG